MKVFSSKILYCHEQRVITNKLHHEYVICFKSHKPCRVLQTKPIKICLSYKESPLSHFAPMLVAVSIG